MNQYAYRRASRFTGNLSAEVVGVELNKIWKAHDQRLLPADVVEAARPPKAVLHPCFEWDDAAAADHYRIWQARQIIKSVRVIEEDKKEGPMFVHVRLDDEPKPFYQQARVLREEPVQYLAALAEARLKLSAAMESFEELRRMAVMDKRDEGDIAKLVAITEALATARAVANRLQ